MFETVKSYITHKNVMILIIYLCVQFYICHLFLTVFFLAVGEKYHRIIQSTIYFQNLTIFFLALKFFLFFHPLIENVRGQCLNFYMTNIKFHHGSHFPIKYLKHYWFSYLALLSGVINQSRIIW